MWAAFASHTSVVKRLIEGGANVHQEDDNSATALLHATWRAPTLRARPHPQGRA